jgi:predicted O-methyltransferase YrrM
MTMREHVDHALAETELTDWVEVHAGTAAEIAATWTKPIDFLFLDADMSPKGARIIYEAWAPFVKPGGWIALHNSDEREYQPDHEGNHLIAVQEFVEPYYIGVETTHSLTFACKV